MCICSNFELVKLQQPARNNRLVRWLGREGKERGGEGKGRRGEERRGGEGRGGEEGRRGEERRGRGEGRGDA